MTYKEAKTYIEKIAGYGSVLGLTSMRNLLCELENPQQDFSCVHIAGTNGKGSILAYISTVLTEAGIRTGRYISPTVLGYLERIQVNGQWISEEEFAILTERVKKAADTIMAKGGQHPTVFEVETAISFLYFKEKKCELVVLETGLGGRLDATNVVTNTEAAVFASVSRDHMGFLGETLEEIAEQKAGIVKRGCTVISGRQRPEVQNVLKQKAREMGCPFILAEADRARILKTDIYNQVFQMEDGRLYEITLAGSHQIENAVTAVEAIGVLREKGFAIPEEAVQKGLKKAVWQGRFTVLQREPLFIIDGAHNEAAALRLRETVENCLQGKTLIYIMGVFRDKEYEKIAKIMCPRASWVYTVTLTDRERSLTAEELKETVEKYGCRAEACRSLPEAVQKAYKEVYKQADEQSAILAFGSLSYLGEVINTVHLT